MPVGPEAIEGLASRLQEPDNRTVIREALSLSERFPAEVVGELWQHSGNSETIGITGPPGVGKSTLVPGLARSIREQEATVGIIAIDPSSPYSGGAILGDRIRMMQEAKDQGYDIAGDEGVWIRSFSAAGHLGGVSKATLPAMLVFDVAGKDFVIVETVGVGQSELEIRSLVDTAVVALQPDSGDSIQAMKAGLMDVPDIFCINKSDMFTPNQLNRFRLDLEGNGVPVVETAARSGKGVDELLGAIVTHRNELDEATMSRRRKESLRLQLAQLSLAYSDTAITDFIDSENGQKILEEVIGRGKDPFQAAREIHASITLE
jgi:LAO/AO transport system kinase